MINACKDGLGAGKAGVQEHSGFMNHCWVLLGWTHLPVFHWVWLCQGWRVRLCYPSLAGGTFEGPLGPALRKGSFTWFQEWAEP